MKKMLVRAAKAHASTGVEGSGKMINPESSKASVVYLVSNPNAKRSTNSSIRSQTWSCSAGKESCLVINAAAAGLSEVSPRSFRACFHFNLHNNQLKKIAQGYFGRNLSGRVTVSAFTDHFFLAVWQPKLPPPSPDPLSQHLKKKHPKICWVWSNIFILD